jgi:tRNA pseudouridine55 synthase
VTTEVHGVVVVDKPAGVTSAAVVAKVKRALGARRLGHTGTLDPMATGVLPLCIGEGTKIAGYLLAENKSYEGELELGVNTDTYDADGQVTECRRDAAAAVTESELRRAMAGFLGSSDQIPPMFSAIKQGGKPLHKLARAGKTVTREARSITLTSFELVEFANPKVGFSVSCSKGTYVRSLAVDLGELLGCGAHLTSLRRTRSGDFDISQAVQVDEITPETVAGKLLSPAQAVAFFPGFTVPEACLIAVSHGQQLAWGQISGDPAPVGTLRLLTGDAELLALAEVVDDHLRYVRVFRYGLT